jgi:hypothetical protein
MELHPDCASLAFLLGTWRGQGQGEYPTIEEFRYNEEATFGHVGKPFLTYSQKTKNAETGEPMHAEAGYLRALGGNEVEFIIVQPSGIIELHSGTAEGQKLDLSLDSVHITPTAKSVTDVWRSLWVDDEGVMHYLLTMAAVGQPLTHHLAAELRHQD